jgi:PAS domain S-box-containing protein
MAARRALRGDDGRFQATFDFAAVGIGHAAPDGRYLRVNRKLCEIVGYTREELLQRTFQEITHPADLDADIGRVRQVLAGDIESYTMEKRYLHRSGAVVWVNLSVSLVRREDGEPDYFLSIVEDISGRKQVEAHRERLLGEAEAARREVEAARRMVTGVIERVSDGFVALDSDWRYTYVNQKAAELLQREKPEDLVGRHIWTEYPEGVGQPFHQAYLRACETRQPIVLEERYGPWDRWFENRIYPSADGLTIYFTEVTDRKRAEGALRESEERLRRAQRVARLGFLDWNLKTNEIFLSEEARRLYGLGPEAGLTTPDLVARIVHPDDRARVSDDLDLAIRGVKDYDIAHRVVRPDGEVLWVRAQAELSRDADGVPLTLLGTVADITDLKRAEDELRRLNAELEGRVARRTAELQAKNRELDSFAYSVSHDLKAPLRGIDGYSRLLLEDHADRLDEEGRAFLHNVRMAATQMSRLIDDLLAYSRLERRQLHTRRIELRPFVEDLVAQRGDEVRSRGAEVAVEVPAMVVSADRQGLSLAVRNLVENALKFTRDVPRPRVEIGGRPGDATCLLWVRDNGIGFDMKFHDRIFEAFQRLHRAEDYPGSGVGLAMVRTALHRMGGRAWAESEPGRGATFFVEIPRERA